MRLSFSVLTAKFAKCVYLIKRAIYNLNTNGSLEVICDHRNLQQFSSTSWLLASLRGCLIDTKLINWNLPYDGGGPVASQRQSPLGITEVYVIHFEVNQWFLRQNEAPRLYLYENKSRNYWIDIFRILNLTLVQMQINFHVIFKWHTYYELKSDYISDFCYF